MLMNKSLSARASARVQPFRNSKAPVLRRPRSAVAEMQATSTSYELDPDNASILVCGGGGVALSVTRKLKDMGSWVWMMQRTDVRKAEIEKMMAFVPRGDALNKDDVQKVMDGEAAGAAHNPDAGVQEGDAAGAGRGRGGEGRGGGGEAKGACVWGYFIGAGGARGQHS